VNGSDETAVEASITPEDYPEGAAGCRRSGRRVRPFGEREQKMASIAQDAHLPAARRVGRRWRAEHAIEER
jgi:hypothetical protein